MPARNQAAFDFLASRRSRPAKLFTGPVPSRDELMGILTAALRVPDHGKLEPWRLVVLQCAAFQRLADLAEARATELGGDAEKIAKGRGQYDLGKLAVVVISSPKPSPRIPAVEQLLSAGALCLNIVTAAEAAGWGAHGVDFPGHFLLGLRGQRETVVVDVFAGGAALDPPGLRALLKLVEGEAAELRPGLMRPMTKREVLLRLQNNIKLRRLRAGALDGALACTEDMLRLAPDVAPLWREAGLMNQRLDRIGAALSCFDHFLELVPEGESAARIRALTIELRQRLN